MRTLIPVFAFLLITVSSYAQVEYTPFQFETSIWEESSYAVWFSRSEYELSIQGDTLIDGITYYKLWSKGVTYYYDSPQQDVITDSLVFDGYHGAIREYDSKRVEFLKETGSTPIQIYDFNLAEGDTTEVYDFVHGGSIEAVVTAVDTVEICGSLRNRYQLNFPEWTPVPSYLIEGIGSTHGLLPTYDLFESAASLHCYSNSTCDCFEAILDTRQEVRDEIKISVYPNPVSQNEFTVSSAYLRNSSLDIYNHLGQVIENKTIDRDHFSIDCSDWPNGCYFLKFSDGTRQQTKKIVLQRE